MAWGHSWYPWSRVCVFFLFLSEMCGGGCFFHPACQRKTWFSSDGTTSLFFFVLFCVTCFCFFSGFLFLAGFLCMCACFQFVFAPRTRYERLFFFLFFEKFKASGGMCILPGYLLFCAFFLSGFFWACQQRNLLPSAISEVGCGCILFVFL